MRNSLLYKRIMVLWGSILFSLVAFSQQLIDQTNALGINQYHSTQRFGTGISCFDINNDGWLDLHVSTAFGERDHIYLNNEGKSFKEISENLGLNLTGGSIASLWLDFDGDHLVDLLVMNSCHEVDSCDGKNLQLFKQKTDGTFFEVTDEAGLNIFSQNHLNQVKGGLAAGDLNLDGFLDIVLTHWEDGELYVFINNGEGGFIESTSKLGIKTFYETFFQPLIWDQDQDGDPDIYVNVDAGPNRLYVNHNFKFREEAFQRGLHAFNNEMGIAIGDFDNNEVFDLFMTNIDYLDLFNIKTGTYNVLYQGTKEGNKNVYQDVANNVGVNRSGWGWGTTFLDINNDGFQDLAATNGVDNINDQSKLWLNQGGNSFIDISRQTGFADSLDGTSLISLDFDQDGDLDLVQTTNTYFNQQTSIRFLENDCPQCGHFITVRPRMEGTNHYAIGATVKVKAGDQNMTRLITAGTSFYAQEPAEAHFGLDNVTMIDEIEVIWPGGAISSLKNITADQIIEITDQDILHIPRFIKVQKSSDSIYLNWAHISSQETWFEIEIADNPSFNDALFDQIPSPLREFLIKTPLSTGNIFLRIRAGNDQLFSKWSPIKWLGKYIIPPTTLQINNDDVFNPILVWDDNSSNESNFILERSSDSLFIASQTNVIEENETSFQDHDLIPNERYYYRIYASNDSNFRSDYSNIIVHDVIENKDISIYPNPASNSVHLPLEKDQVKIIDISGREFTIYRMSNQLYNISHLPGGIYTIVNHDETTSFQSLRFIKITQ